MISLKDKKYTEVEIIDITDNGLQPTFDVEVKNNHHYLTNDNIVSHNSSIFSNITSGGVEPVFMQEYVRTVIVPDVPEHLKDVTPKYWEGQFTETSFFKEHKEGDEVMLKGVDKDGITWKIDRSRGLTKEVPCEDYGVRWLKERNEWDSNADWAIAAMDLSVKDHVTDLQGFAKYIDTAISKTISVPNDYPYEDFKKVYLDVYNSGYIKGCTTYRVGSMTAVLAPKEEKNSCQEEIILEDVKLPDSSPAVVKKIIAEGKKWYLTVILNEDQTRPMALFVHTNNAEKTTTTTDAVERLMTLAKAKKIPEKYILDTERKIANVSNTEKITRVISLLLRHGVRIGNIIAVIEMTENVVVGSFLFQVKRFLSNFLKEGEKNETEKCPICSGELIFSEGCMKCASCGGSKCG